MQICAYSGGRGEHTSTQFCAFWSQTWHRSVILSKEVWLWTLCRALGMWSPRGPCQKYSELSGWKVLLKCLTKHKRTCVPQTTKCSWHQQQTQRKERGAMFEGRQAQLFFLAWHTGWKSEGICCCRQDGHKIYVEIQWGHRPHLRKGVRNPPSWFQKLLHNFLCSYNTGEQHSSERFDIKIQGLKEGPKRDTLHYLPPVDLLKLQFVTHPKTLPLNVVTNPMIFSLFIKLSDARQNLVSDCFMFCAL